MGFFKKLTKPISKVLDKIVPNEVKPFLPYLAAFAPFMMPPGMAFASKGIFSNPMFTRALMSGGANLASQLAQEGSEGEFSPLSVALASGVGALGAQNAPEFFQGMQRGPTGVDQFGDISVPYSDTGIMASISDAIGKGGVGAAEFIGEAGKVLRPGETEAGLDMATLKAASIPVSQGTADLAMADARRALQDYEDEMAGTDDPLYSDDGRRRAIRAAMEAAGHLEDTILDALASLGLKSGGMVGLKKGGRIGYDKGGSIAKLIDQGMDPSTALSMWQDWEDSGSTLSFNDYVGYGTTENYAHGGQLVKRGPGRSGYAGEKNVDESLKVDAMGDMSKEDLKLYGSLKKGLWKLLKDAPGSASTFLEALNPFDDKDVDWSGTYGRALTFDNAEKKLIYGLISTQNKPKERIKFIEEFTDNYDIKLDYFPQDENEMPRYLKGGGISSVLPKGREADYRGGGVIPIGSRERADDVPARLSKNEFVMTADAVRAAGGGNINQGAKRMYNLMNNLEARV